MYDAYTPERAENPCEHPRCDACGRSACVGHHHACIRELTDDELTALLDETGKALVRRDIGQKGVYRAAALRNAVLHERERRAGTNPWNR